METPGGNPDATAAGEVEVTERTASASDELGPTLVDCSTLDLTTAGSDENGISASWDVVVEVWDVVVEVWDVVVEVRDVVVVVCDWLESGSGESSTPEP